MANITVSVPTSNITVDTTNSIVNVASTSSNVVLSATAAISNADVREAISVSNVSGFGDLAYDDSSTSNGIIQYTGVSTSEIRGQVSATAPMLYNSTTGVISIDSGAVFSGKTTDDLAQGSQNIYFSQSGATVNTDALPEGSTNLYLTDTNFNNKFAAKTTNDLAEGTTNKYYANTLVSDYLLSNTQTSVNVTTSLSTANVNINHIQSRNGGNVTMGDQLAYRNQSTFEPYFDFQRPTSTAEYGINLGKPSKRFKDIFSFRTFASDIVNSTSSNVISLASITGTSYTAGGNTDALYRPAIVEFGGFLEDTSGTWSGNWMSGGNPKLRPQGYDYTVGAYDYNYAIPMWSPGGVFSGGAGALPDEIPLFNGLTDLDPVIDTSVIYAPKTDFHIGDGNHAYRDAAIEVVKTNRIFIGNAEPQGGNVKLDGLGSRATALYADMNSVGSDRIPTLKLGYSNTAWGDKNEGTLTTYADIVDTKGDFAITGNISFSKDLIVGGNLEVTGDINYREVEDLLVQDQTITLNYGNASAQDAQIIVDRSGAFPLRSNTDIKWNEATSKWTFSNNGSTYNNMLTLADIPADAVTSVNGDTGVVVLDTDDIAEGTAKYYATSLFNTDFATKSTTDLAEGTNLYFTDARADARVNLQTGTNLDLSSKSTTDLAEGTNLYFTNARANTVISTNTTDNLTEGSTNLYYTQGRFDTAFTAKDTDDLSEGSTNLYYTDGRSRSAVSVTQASASGTGALAYNSGTGVFTYTPPALPTGDITEVVAGVGLSGGGTSGAVTVNLDPTITTAAASGGGSLAYDNTSGVFTFAPADTQTDAEVRALLSVTSGTAVSGGSLGYNNATGIFTYAPAIPGIALTDLSITSATASGNGSLAYDDTSGVFTFTPADTSLATKSTTDLAEGTNLYYTDARSRSAVSVTTAAASGDGALAYDSGTGVFTFTPPVITPNNDEQIINGTSSVKIPSYSGNINITVGDIAVAEYSTDLSTVTAGSWTVGRTYTIQTLGTTNFTFVGAVQVSPSSIVAGTEYIINSTGDTDFTLIGAANSNSGTVFTATGAGTGTGTVIPTKFTSTGTGLVRAGSFAQGYDYTIVEVDTTDFTLFGAASNTVGVTFTCTSTTTQSGGGTATQGTGTVIATYPADFEVQGDITAVNNIYAEVDVIAFANVSASKNVQAVQASASDVGGVQAINGQSTIGSYNNQTPFVNTETGIIAVQAGDLAANVYSVPRFSSIKMPTIPANVGGGNFTPDNIERIGNASSVWDNTASAMPPGSLVGVYDPKIYKRRAFNIPILAQYVDPIFAYTGEGATPHASGTILFDTDSSNTTITSAQSFGNLGGYPAYTTAPVSQGIIKFRTLQPDLLPTLPTQFAYTEANDFANSTVAYVDDKFRIGREDNSTSFSFPKTAGAVNQTLVLDANRDLLFENKGKLISYTSIEILALSGMVPGDMVYNSTDDLIAYYDATSNWRNITQGTIVT